MPDHSDPPPTTLAHGAAKSSDVERVRRDVDEAEARVAHDDEAAAARRLRRVRGREGERKPDAEP